MLALSLATLYNLIYSVLTKLTGIVYNISYQQSVIVSAITLTGNNLSPKAGRTALVFGSSHLSGQ